MLKKAVQRGRSERRAEAHSLPCVEVLSDARTKLADFFSILLMSRLSKSRYLAGLQCHERLYLEIHARDLAPPPG